MVYPTHKNYKRFYHIGGTGILSGNEIEYTEWLKSLKPGDPVGIKDRNWVRTEGLTVDRITKTLIVVKAINQNNLAHPNDEYKFRIGDGTRMSEFSSRDELFPINSDEYQEHLLATKEKEIFHEIRKEAEKYINDMARIHDTSFGSNKFASHRKILEQFVNEIKQQIALEQEEYNKLNS